MALQGTIDAFPLVDVLQLLAASRKTGRLVVEGDRGLGQLFVVDGLLVGGGVRGREEGDPDATVFELLRFGDGSFLFESGADAPEAPWEPVELPTVLEAATALLQEWAAIEEVVPSLSHRVAMAPTLGQESVKVDDAEWALLSASGTRPDVATVAADLELTEHEACRRVVALVLRGLMVVDEPDPAGAGPQADPVAAAAGTTVPELPPGPASDEPVAAEQAAVVRRCRRRGRHGR